MSSNTNVAAGNGTPFIAVLEPTKLDGYDRSVASGSQPAAIPRMFLDAMEVREAVFVEEQGVPLAHEHDEDDARSVHLVIYASVARHHNNNNTTTNDIGEEQDATSSSARPRRSEARTTPIGTLRIAPFPHPPHPVAGGRYVDNQLQPGEEEEEHGGGYTASQEARQSAALPYGHDRATTFHDGKEPYVKLGRLAVVKEFRGHRIAGQLWTAARTWLEQHPGYFNPSVQELGMEALGAGGVHEIPRWRGLVCVHAQEQVEPVWRRWGFQVDEGMGRWDEEGIPHVGMFQRLTVKDLPPRVS
jgi:predicted GNAT family N-acyltransferase